MKFKDSPFAHHLLDGLKGVEIGGAAHNPFNIPGCLNVDMSGDMDTVFKRNEEILCGEKMPVDIVAPGDDLPFPDNMWDFVLSSHVLEHFFDPIKAVDEWLRVVRPEGFVYAIVPSQTALKDQGETRPCTTVGELLGRHSGNIQPHDVDMSGYQVSTVSGEHMGDHGHWSVWNLRDFLALCAWVGWKPLYWQEPDDKVGNGFTVVLTK